MNLWNVLIAIIIAGGLSALVKYLPIGQVWKMLAWGAIALFFTIWLIGQLKASGINPTI